MPQSTDADTTFNDLGSVITATPVEPLTTCYNLGSVAPDFASPATAFNDLGSGHSNEGQARAV